MQFKRHPKVVLLSAWTQVQRQNKGEKAPIKEALYSSQVGVKDWNKTFSHPNRSVCASGKYLMAGGEMPSKQSREQRVGNTTAGQRKRRKQSTNHLPTSKKQRFVSSKDAFASPGEFSELQHLLCSMLITPKESSAGVLRAVQNSARPLNRSKQNSPTVFNWRTWKHSDPADHLDKNRHFPAF